MLCYKIITCSLINKELCQINKLTNADFVSTLLSLINCTVSKKEFALLKGPGNKSKYRLSLLLFFAYGGLPRGKKFLRI